MSRNIALTLLCLLLAAFVSAAEEPVSATPDLLSMEGPACQADPAASAFSKLGIKPVFRGHDPATCGRCLHCASTNVCAGKLIGDVCSGTGGTCQAFDGCALYNCCRCSNIQPALAAPGE